METCNFTGGSVASFWPVGFPSLQVHQFFLFFIFLIFYLLILSSNLTIIVVMATDPKLHKPMYFFLTNLSILDILLTTIPMPRMLAMFLIKAKSVCSKGCFLQMYFFQGLAVTETFLLVVMSYDRDEAVCHSLHYAARMTKQKNLRLAVGAWFSALLVPIQPIIQSSQLTFSKTPKVNHCFCDHLAVVQAACQNTDTTFQSFLGFTISMTVAFGPLLLAVISYACIMVSVLQIKSKEGRRRTFSTCFSHLVVVITYYFSIALAFLAYRIKMPSDMTFAILTPLVNPLIYTLRNRDIKRAVRQLASSKVFSMQKERLRLDQVRSKEIFSLMWVFY